MLIGKIIYTLFKEYPSQCTNTCMQDQQSYIVSHLKLKYIYTIIGSSNFMGCLSNLLLILDVVFLYFVEYSFSLTAFGSQLWSITR